jgi:3-methylcrotonyl-CoA carboxylase alpha subunit
VKRRIRKVLIANRGEIAVRIATTLREMGIASVAVFSEADREAWHRRFCDESVALPGREARDNYLRGDLIIDAAQSAGADAIHPGYGFLSENPEFSKAVEAAGLVFIGPTAESIHKMGDKAGARAIADAAGVPIVPGRNAVADEELHEAVAEVGFPLILKPSAGGGGKGMVVLQDDRDLAEKVAAARRVAQAAFGDDALVMERYVKPARHIEIQVFGDGQGDAVALGERECSLQRRHQKVIEECPSPVVAEDLRQRMGEAAASLARSVQYRGAGTVEFLLGPDDSFYFLEMNTRLQVEHPVTEEVYGVDLVRAQLEVAEQGTLPDALKCARPRGHAIEARLYAEDPRTNFLPTPGPVLRLLAPSGPGLRFDAAFDGPGRVGTEYDPMIAKVIAWGETREAARRRLIEGLKATAVVGITTNADFLVALMEDERVASGDFGIHSLEAWLEDGSLSLDDEIPDAIWAVAAMAFARGGASASASGSVATVRPDPFDLLGPWRALSEGARS